MFLKPSFSFPFIKPPNMIPNVDEKVLKSEFDFECNKPEAPWIKRCQKGGIKFTDEIQDSYLLVCNESVKEEAPISPDPPV